MGRDRSPTNQQLLAAHFRRAAALSVIFFFLLSYLSADSVEREAGAKALARISPGRIRHPQIACFALLRPLCGSCLDGSCR